MEGRQMRNSSNQGQRFLSALALAGLVLMLAFASQAAAQKASSLAATTGGTGHVRGTSVELQGTVKPGGQATTYYFEFGPTTAYGAKTTPGNLPAGTVPVKVT